MSCSVNIGMVQAAIPEGCNIIIGQSHFIKTVEDLYEALVTSSPATEFGIAFCEASGDCLIRHDGNKKDLVDTAIENAKAISKASPSPMGETRPPNESETMMATPAITAAIAAQVMPETRSRKAIQPISAAIRGTPACIRTIFATVV